MIQKRDIEFWRIWTSTVFSLLFLTMLGIFLGNKAQGIENLENELFLLDVDSIETPIDTQALSREDSLSTLFVLPTEYIKDPSEASNRENIEREREEQLSESRNDDFYKLQTLLFYLFCGILSLYAFVRWRYTEFSQIVRRTLSNERIAHMYFEDAQSAWFLPATLLYVNTVFITGIFLFFVLKFTNIFEGWSFYQMIFYSLGLALIFLGIKYFLQRLLALVLPKEANIRFYIYNKLIIQIVLGVLLLPLLIFYSFNSHTLGVVPLILAGFLVLLSLGFQLYRAFMTNRKNLMEQPLHFFLYLCTLEIAPVLILVKLHILQM